MIRTLLATRRVLVAILALLTTACTSTQPLQTVVRDKAPTASQATMASLKRSPLLGPGDEVEVFVWGYKDFSQRATVTFDGTLPYPMLGEFPVAGKSVAQVEKEIRAALTDYIKEPIVRVSVAAVRPLRIHVLGEVNKPGVYTLSTPDTALIEAIGRAGGLTPDAREAVVVVRNAGEQIQIHTVDFRRITREGDLSSNLVLAEGDIVYVPIAAIADMARDARRLVDIVTPLIAVENAAILFEPFLRALSGRSPTTNTTQTVIIRQ